MLRDRKQQPYEDVANYIANVKALMNKSEKTYGDDEKVKILLDGMLPHLREKIVAFELQNVEELQRRAMKIENSMKTSNENKDHIMLLQTAAGASAATSNYETKKIEELKETVQK